MRDRIEKALEPSNFIRGRLLDYSAALLPSPPGVLSGAVGASRGSEGNRLLPALRAALAGATGYVGGGQIGGVLGGLVKKPELGRALGKLIGSAELGRLGSRAHLVKDSAYLEVQKMSEQDYVQGFMDKCAEMGVDPEALAKQAALPKLLLKGMAHAKKLPGGKDVGKYLDHLTGRTAGKVRANAGRVARNVKVDRSRVNAIQGRKVVDADHARDLARLATLGTGAVGTTGFMAGRRSASKE